MRAIVVFVLLVLGLGQSAAASSLSSRLSRRRGSPKHRAALPDLYEASVIELQVRSAPCTPAGTTPTGRAHRQASRADTSRASTWSRCVARLVPLRGRSGVSCVPCAQAYFARIEEVNLQGPELRAVIETNPSALAQAAALDAERRATGPRSALHGIPVLVKDNIATLASEGERPLIEMISVACTDARRGPGMNTTAGSYSLLRSIVPDDAGVVKRLRAAGAIILGGSLPVYERSCMKR